MNETRQDHRHDNAKPETIKKSVLDIADDGVGIICTDAGNGSGGPVHADPDSLRRMIENGCFDDAVVADVDEDLMDAAFTLCGFDPEIVGGTPSGWVQVNFAFCGDDLSQYHQIAWIWID